MSFCSLPYSAAVMPRPNSVGSKPGSDTSARTSPLSGSSATTAPRWPASAASATRCTCRSMVSTRSSPAVGGDEGALALHRATLRVHQHLAEAVAAMQLALEGALDAELADQRRAGVGGAVAVLQILLAPHAHVAERVHRHVAVRVPARLARLDVQPRELEAPHGEARHVFVRHAQQDRHAVEGAARLDGALDLGDVFGADQIERDQG